MYETKEGRLCLCFGKSTSIVYEGSHVLSEYTRYYQIIKLISQSDHPNYISYRIPVQSELNIAVQLQHLFTYKRLHSFRRLVLVAAVVA